MNRSSGTGLEKWLYVASLYASRVRHWFGSAMCDATQPERNNMPTGMLLCQKDIGSPNVCTSSPGTVRRWAAADNPYGPAPRIATSYFVILVSLTESLARDSNYWWNPKSGIFQQRFKKQSRDEQLV